VTSTQIKLLPGGAAPPAGLAVGAVGSGGTFAAATYFWKITFRTKYGETSGSNEATVAIALNGSANLTWTTPPAGIIAVRVYRGTVTNTENVLVAAELPGNATAFTDTGATFASATTPPAAGSFVTANLDSAARALKTSAALSGLTGGQLAQALRGINYWHNFPTDPANTVQAAKILAAVGLGIQEV
jgi:hypothetical protein